MQFVATPLAQIKSHKSACWGLELKLGLGLGFGGLGFHWATRASIFTTRGTQTPATPPPETRPFCGGTRPTAAAHTQGNQSLSSSTWPAGTPKNAQSDVAMLPGMRHGRCAGLAEASRPGNAEFTARPCCSKCTWQQTGGGAQDAAAPDHGLLRTACASRQPAKGHHVLDTSITPAACRRRHRA